MEENMKKGNRKYNIGKKKKAVKKVVKGVTKGDSSKNVDKDENELKTPANINETLKEAFNEGSESKGTEIHRSETLGPSKMASLRIDKRHSTRLLPLGISGIRVKEPLTPAL
jgi:hypothetical protein